MMNGNIGHKDKFRIYQHIDTDDKVIGLHWIEGVQFKTNKDVYILLITTRSIAIYNISHDIEEGFILESFLPLDNVYVLSSFYLCESDSVHIICGGKNGLIINAQWRRLQTHITYHVKHISHGIHIYHISSSTDNQLTVYSGERGSDIYCNNENKMLVPDEYKDMKVISIHISLCDSIIICLSSEVNGYIIVFSKSLSLLYIHTIYGMKTCHIFIPNTKDIDVSKHTSTSKKKKKRQRACNICGKRSSDWRENSILVEGEISIICQTCEDNVISSYSVSFGIISYSNDGYMDYYHIKSNKDIQRLVHIKLDESYNDSIHSNGNIMLLSNTEGIHIYDVKTGRKAAVLSYTDCLNRRKKRENDGSIICSFHNSEPLICITNGICVDIWTAYTNNV